MQYESCFIKRKKWYTLMVLVTYDVNTEQEQGKKHLRRVAKVCVNYGQRVQNSVFECDLEPAQFVVLKETLAEIIDMEKDSLRFYLLGKNWERRVELLGRTESYHPQKDVFIF